MDELNDPTLSLEEALMDTYRIDYFYRHLYYISTAIKLVAPSLYLPFHNQLSYFIIYAFLV